MTTEAEIPPSPSARKASGQSWQHLFCWHFVVLLAVIVFFGAIRWRLLDMPLERDEGEYAYAGQLILQDIPPYQLAYNMKLPGTYAAYAAVLAVFGQTARGIHLGLLLVNAVSVILLYVVTARLFGTLAGTLAGSTYALLSTHQVVLGLAAHPRTSSCSRRSSALSCSYAPRKRGAQRFFSGPASRLASPS